MDVLERIREECDQIKVEKDPDIDTKERLQHLNAQLRIATIDVEKKILNSYKNLLKVKWFRTSDGRFVESLIFNDKTGYLKYVKMEATDPCRTDKFWLEIGKACENLYMT